MDSERVGPAKGGATTEVASVPVKTDESQDTQSAAIVPPTNEMLDKPYKVAGHEVDFRLPDSIKKELDKELVSIDKRVREYIEDFSGMIEGDEGFDSKYRSAMMGKLALWSVKKTKNWHINESKEIFSIKECVEKQQGACTEKSNFLYATILHARKSKFKKQLHLIKPTFTQAFDESVSGGGKNGHVCVKVKFDNKDITYDLALSTNGTIPQKDDYQYAREIGLPVHVAGMLSNKLVELYPSIVRGANGNARLKRGHSDALKEADELQEAITALAPDDPFVQYAAFRFNHSVAVAHRQSHRNEGAKEYAAKALSCLEAAKKSTDWESFKEQMVTGLNANIRYLQSLA